MRDGTDHLITISYEEVRFGHVSDKSGRTVDSGGNGRRVEHDNRVLVPTHNGRGRQSTSERVVVSDRTTNGRLSQAALSSGQGEPRFLSMHSFPSGGAVSRARAGEDVSTIMQRAFWKSPNTARRYVRPAEVLSPGTTGHTRVPRITGEKCYRGRLTSCR